MRDPLAPVINGFDLSGIVNRYSFQCDQFYTEGDNGGTLLDGSTVTDVLAAKVRLSWTLNSLSTAQYAALNAALNAGTSPDTVNAYVFDPTIDALRLARFHVTRPPFQFAFDMNAGKMMSYAGGEIVLEEASSESEPTPPIPIDGGEGWTLYDNGTLEIYYEGDMPDYMSAGTPPWRRYQKSITSIVIHNSVTSIGVYAFNSLDKMRSVFIPHSVTRIGYGAFLNNLVLNSVSMPSSVTNIDSHAFYGCISLTSFSIPPGVTSIASYLFAHCSKLSSILIPDGVTSIGNYAFYYSGLRFISLPDSVSSIGKYAFYYSKLSAIALPDGVTSIGEYAFYNTLLSSIKIPYGVTSIANNTFLYCSSLVSVTIPNSVTLINENAFNGCTRLTDVYYSGTQSEWNAITIKSGNTPITSATKHYNSTGPT